MHQVICWFGFGSCLFLFSVVAYIVIMEMFDTVVHEVGTEVEAAVETGVEVCRMRDILQNARNAERRIGLRKWWGREMFMIKQAL